jgi:flavin-dependent dehydrogenase
VTSPASSPAPGQTAKNETLWDTIVVGAGPAGASVANLLAQDGHRILVLEKDEFPRFHIGESLLPVGCRLHEKLGVTPTQGTFLSKRGAEFVCERTDRRKRFAFDQMLPGESTQAWQVDRAKYDAALRDAAIAAGAEVRHGEKVSDVAIGTDGVKVTTQSGTVRGRFVVDATGQDRMLARRGKTIVPYKHFGKAAVYTHFEGLSDDALARIGPGNDIRIMLLDQGWGWVIPLPGRRLSVGVATRQQGVTTDLFDAAFADSDTLRSLTDGAQRQDTHIVRNFSYANSASSGARFAAIGDAACFLDPVFSSGVALAMVGAEQLAKQLSPALHARTEANPDLAAPAKAHMGQAYRIFGALIDRFYNSRFASTIFLSETDDIAFRRYVLSVLGGDVWRDDNPFQDMLMRARRRERSATIPVA